MSKLTKFTLVSTLSFSIAGSLLAETGKELDGSLYQIQLGDTLSQIAAREYQDPQLWRVIAKGTDAKAAVDPDVNTIGDPSQLSPGQMLWIPGERAKDILSAANNTDKLMQLYKNAVKDAADAEPQEISRNLVALTEATPSLIWRTQNDRKQLLALTWTSWDGYDSQTGQTITTTRDTWVTSAPELKKFCTQYAKTGQNLTLRLEQLLGLPPGNGKTRFVELWVTPSDLFRPSADPEVSDHEAEVHFPESKLSPISQSHKDWYTSLSAQSYGDDGYPWTRLGYTYDWGNPITEVGLSEFVIQTGAQIEVKDVILNEDYCL